MVTLFNSPQHHVHATVGGTAPSGAVDLRLKTDHKSNLDDGYTHYGMQLGSGTWDFKPSLTYTGKDQDWSWGGQLSGTKRLQNKNPSGYALGDMFGSSVWGGYNLTHWLNTSIRAAYTWQGSISGQYPGDNRDPKASDFTCNKADYTSPDTWDDLGNPGPNVFHVADYNACSADAASSYRQEKARIDALIRPSPMDSPKNYGGHYLDIGFGLNVNIPNGAFAGHNLKFEWLQPVYTNVNGYQLDRSGALTFTWGVGF
jgi:hypothetical protein